VPGDVVDEGRHSADHDRQSEASTPDVPKVPEQDATASCAGKRDSGYGISSGSTNEIPAAKRK